MPSDLELLGRLLLAAVLGGAIGAKRELNDRAAGLRTHRLLTSGPACSRWSRPMGSAPALATRAGSRPRSSPGSGSSAAALSSATA
jgi:hypothetical protein